MGIFISVGKTIECVVIALFFAAAATACSTKILGALQSLGYSGKKLLRWCGKDGNMIWQRLILLATCCVLLCAVFGLCFSFVGTYAAVISLAAYLIFFILYIAADKRIAPRCPAARTPRFKRLQIITFTASCIIAYIVVTLLNFADYAWGNAVFSVLRYVPLAILPLVLIYVICLANLIDKIYEVPHNRKYIAQAKSAVALSGIKVIGVTGSYGKTSVKNILESVLSKKYRVLSTPRSYNTPLGIARTINGADLNNYDIFIAEMGARNVGDIAELCEICPPDYSVITGICPQHLESFGSLENIVAAKSEILRYTKVKSFVADDCFDMFNYAFPAERVGCVSDIKTDGNGTNFALTLGENRVKVHTKLLGEHSAKNIALAAQLAYELDISFIEICSAIGELDFTPHRLQLIKKDGVNILDDGYNCNVKGAAAALQVLRLYGGRKICVTPGMVELGTLEESENYELGKKLAGLDYVILVGETLIKPAMDGYLAEGGDEQKIVKVPTLKAAEEELKNYLTVGDTVLFLNDLPDIYL